MRGSAGVATANVRPLLLAVDGDSAQLDRIEEQRPGEAVELGHHQGVAPATRRQCLAQTRPVTVGAGEPVVDVDAPILAARTRRAYAFASTSARETVVLSERLLARVGHDPNDAVQP